MKISVELTLIPLQDNFREAVINFITRLRATGLQIEENALSTHVFGEYDVVLSVLNKEIKHSFETNNAVIANMKIVKTDRSNYEPRF